MLYREHHLFAGVAIVLLVYISLLLQKGHSFLKWSVFKEKVCGKAGSSRAIICVFLLDLAGEVIHVKAGGRDQRGYVTPESVVALSS